ncbi:hypothetical protein CVT24_008052 [Panaeolus cyanescens]|uniref:Uncharacterized protein n=1 Tax=Panaeolus cyanescens TaxID=181874 RepID=A0A409YQP7_9AGAR|nr:hypothetical protein CVT24_008052 [Panaeolus cyanescens]
MIPPTYNTSRSSPDYPYAPTRKSSESSKKTASDYYNQHTGHTLSSCCRQPIIPIPSCTSCSSAHWYPDHARPAAYGVTRRRQSYHERTKTSPAQSSECSCISCVKKQYRDKALSQERNPTTQNTPHQTHIRDSATKHHHHNPEHSSRRYQPYAGPHEQREHYRRPRTVECHLPCCAPPPHHDIQHSPPAAHRYPLPSRSVATELPSISNHKRRSNHSTSELEEYNRPPSKVETSYGASRDSSTSSPRSRVMSTSHTELKERSHSMSSAGVSITRNNDNDSIHHDHTRSHSSSPSINTTPPPSTPSPAPSESRASPKSNQGSNPSRTPDPSTNLRAKKQTRLPPRISGPGTGGYLTYRLGVNPLPLSDPTSL